MKFTVIALAAVLAAGVAPAQKRKAAINAETPEGQLLQQIGQEQDAAKRAAMLEEFEQKYPKHESLAWVYEQMVTGYSGAGQKDKALAAGEKLLALDPADMEMAHSCLKLAEGAKNAEQVRKWSVLTSQAARKVTGSQKPADADEAEGWAERVELAKQIDVYAEYALFAAAAQSTDPKQVIALGDALEEINPQSQYLPQMAEPRLRAYMQSGESDKAVALAAKVVEKDQSSPEMLLAAASGYEAKKQPDKVIELATKAIEVTNAKAKPAGVADADWANYKAQLVSRSNFMIGMQHAAANRWPQAEQALKLALPGIKADATMSSAALFHLGLANYKMAEAGNMDRIRDAVDFFEQCAAVAGPYQAPARQNIKAIRSRYRVQK